MKYRKINGVVYPDSVIIGAGKNPEDYEEVK